MYQDLSTRHDWPIKKAIVDLPIRINRLNRRACSQARITSATQAKGYDEFGNLIGAAI